MQLESHFRTATKLPCNIIVVDPLNKTVQGITKIGPVHISVYTTHSFFRWPKVGENWIIRQENGNWYLDSILPDLEDPVILNDLEPGDAILNVPGRILLSNGNELSTASGPWETKPRVEYEGGHTFEFIPSHDRNTIVLANIVTKSETAASYNIMINLDIITVIEIAKLPESVRQTFTIPVPANHALKLEKIAGEIDKFTMQVTLV